MRGGHSNYNSADAAPKTMVREFIDGTLKSCQTKARRSAEIMHSLTRMHVLLLKRMARTSPSSNTVMLKHRVKSQHIV